MDFSSVDIGVIVAIVGLVVKGAQVHSLEARGGRWDERFNDIERDLSDIKASLARVEAVLTHIEQR